jgi:hypothetical protein
LFVVVLLATTLQALARVVKLLREELCELHNFMLSNILEVGRGVKQVLAGRAVLRSTPAERTAAEDFPERPEQSSQHAAYRQGQEQDAEHE